MHQEKEEKLRIAVVEQDKCKPEKCRKECKRSCPVVKMGKLCIEVGKKAEISELLCIGCNQCVRVCPFGAISIINLPKSLETQTTHRYGRNSFKLHRLPVPRKNSITGILGQNGLGKSTCLKILAGKVLPNFGNFDSPQTEEDVIKHFRGSELQTFFTELYGKKIKVATKPQYIDEIAKKVTGKVEKFISALPPDLLDSCEIHDLLEQDISHLSGGQLQKVTIATCISHKFKGYNCLLFDEITSYLDVKQRLVMSRNIRKIVSESTYIVVVEHDLSILDYLSDTVCVLYGKQGGYGVVTLPYGVREGINVFLSGFIPTENMRFRDHELMFRNTLNEEDSELLMALSENEKRHRNHYPKLVKTLGNFKLTVEEGSFGQSEIIVLLGQNGTGKTTFVKMLAGLIECDEGCEEVPELKVSYKPQLLSTKFEGTVLQFLQKHISAALCHPQFKVDVLEPLKVSELYDQQMQLLSGGEQQRVAICSCLGKPANLYLLDEPSAYLDAEQRIITARLIKRFILHSKATAFVVEHDFIMSTYLADKIIVYQGIPSKNCVAKSPTSLVSGMNTFLKDLDITFRRDPHNFRPRINKLDSVLDKDQKQSGQYFFINE